MFIIGKWAEKFALRPAYCDVIENSVEVVLIFIKGHRRVCTFFKDERMLGKTRLVLGKGYQECQGFTLANLVFVDVGNIFLNI